MQFEHIRDRTKSLQSESFLDRKFWATSDEKLDLWNFVYIALEDKKECGCGFLVLTFVKSINDNEGGNFGCCEGANNDLFELGTKGLSSDVRVGFQRFQQLYSEQRVSVGELKGESREDDLKVASVFKVS